MKMTVAGVLMVAMAGPAIADRDVHAGLNYRSDLGTHQKRVELGGRWNAFEAAVVLDPQMATDSQSDNDVTAMWWFKPSRFAAFAGWRNTSYRLLGETVFHEKVLGGVLAKLPSVGTDRVRLIVGLEVAAEIVRHGDAITTDWLDTMSADELVNLSLFVRAEFTVDL
ncbi:MAG: hypothetical protein H0T46_14680 [Deltaproteobacteria bacterium]|nr:hypothetical protein [Deltaproteobacteria bacterium]